MPRYQHLAGLILCLSRLSPAAIGVDEIVTRADAAIKADWDANLNYSDFERDEIRKSGKVTSRTSQVLMIAGSDYYLPVAIDDQPISPEDRKSEIGKLRTEARRRDAETPAARRERIERFRKQRDENTALLLEFPHAFTFELLREETMNGHSAYVLGATPRKRSGPLSRASKVLAGTRGTVWIDKDTYQPIRAAGEVVTSVPVFGFLAHVLPGTHVEFELAPVGDSTWELSRFSIELRVSRFFFFRSTEITHSTYSNYRPNAEVLSELMPEPVRETAQNPNP